MASNPTSPKQSPFAILIELEKQWKENYYSSIANLSKIIILEIRDRIKNKDI